MALVSFTHTLLVLGLVAGILADSIIVKDTWIQISTPLNPPASRESHTAVYNLVNNTMVVFGGRSASAIYNDIAYYTMTTAMWTAAVKVAGTPPSPRYGHTAVATGRNRMVVFGGRNGTAIWNDVAVFDLLANKWLPAPTIGSGGAPSARAYHTAVVDHYQHVMYVYGGNDDTHFFSDVWALDLDALETGAAAWSLVAPTNGTSGAERSEHSAVMSNLGVMVVFGGRAGGDVGLDDVACFSTITRAWSACLAAPSPAPTVRYGHTAVCSPLQRMTVFGGKNSGGNVVNDVWSLDLNLYIWYVITPGGAPIDARAYHSAVATPFGTMVSFGGINSDGNIDNTFGLYNMASTVLRSAYDGAVLVVILTLLGTILISLCFAMDYMQEQSEIEKEEAIIKAKQEQALLLPKLPAIPKALHIPLGPRAQKFFNEFKTSLDPLQDPPS